MTSGFKAVKELQKLLKNKKCLSEEIKTILDPFNIDGGLLYEYSYAPIAKEVPGVSWKVRLANWTDDASSELFLIELRKKYGKDFAVDESGMNCL